MKWKIPQDGDKRFNKKFAWFPFILGDYKIWLEYYIEEQTYFRYNNKWVTVNLLQKDG
jgi:hypothetical protein